MARVRFTDDFDYEPVFGVTIAYKKDTEMTVKRGCAEQAHAAGKAVYVQAPDSAADDAAMDAGDADADNG